MYKFFHLIIIDQSIFRVCNKMSYKTMMKIVCWLCVRNNNLQFFQDNGISSHGWMWNYLKSFTFVVCMFSYSNWLLLLSVDLILIVTISLLFSFFTKVVFSFFQKNEIISLQPIPVVVK